ncbi:Glycosyltransferase involved in cell wall bisynthesis [Halanaerobium congolense]|uniref:Glycosyltransferase involved in cell wall bisynthesis n=1 Tax=Halanaerobium congolense TaxID=54121 RepID=A0A1G8R2U4_9FIRM|nr:glycosyltransferase family 4 protein [Halanaerobium congolense]SDJ11306.1 Glycosyltransferase involved in cell wall bisynthesis [Halanaerobium congolense]SET66067.1 Glycosyltransferase involved in cell wall bisynthesis [Halanaerobium congolense]
MKILFLTHFYPPETSAAGKRVSGLAMNLNNLDNEVKIITGFPNYPSGKKRKADKFKFYKKDSIEGIDVYRYYVFASTKRNFLTRALNYISFTISSLFSIFKNEKYDVIITASPPLLLGISGLLISKIKKTKFVFDVQDIWPDIALEMEEMSSSSLIYKLLDRIANMLYKESDMISVVTKGKKKKLLEKGVLDEKVKIIRNGFDESFLDNNINSKIKNQFFNNRDFNIVYAGLIGLAQGLDIIIDTANKLKDYKDINFLVIGDGVDKKRLEERTKKLNLDNVKFLGLYPHEDIYTFLKLSDSSLVPLKNDNLRDSVPSKLFEAMAVGCPILLSANGNSADIVKESDCGLVIEPGNSNELKNAILNLYNNEDMKKQFGKNGILYARRHYSRKKISNKLNDFLNKI